MSSIQNSNNFNKNYKSVESIMCRVLNANKTSSTQVKKKYSKKNLGYLKFKFNSVNKRAKKTR